VSDIELDIMSKIGFRVCLQLATALTCSGGKGGDKSLGGRQWQLLALNSCNMGFGWLQVVGSGASTLGFGFGMSK
jgi:hypothetical protein